MKIMRLPDGPYRTADEEADGHDYDPKGIVDQLHGLAQRGVFTFTQGITDDGRPMNSTTVLHEDRSPHDTGFRSVLQRYYLKGIENQHAIALVDTWVQLHHGEVKIRQRAILLFVPFSLPVEVNMKTFACSEALTALDDSALFRRLKDTFRDMFAEAKDYALATLLLPEGLQGIATVKK